MVDQIFYILLAILGLGFLVFIHELGHYWVARREKMKIEAFSIGFGKPIYSWFHKGVHWQIGWLPFGGYVKIAGMQREGSREPYEIADGFYSKTPFQRMRVAFAGPLVNIAFALVVFCLLWLSGGRDKSFHEFTHRIGWVDPKSTLYEQGIRPGDMIESYDGRPFKGLNDVLMASVMKGKVHHIKGYKVDYLTGQRNNFEYSFPGLLTIGAMTPAQYLIFDEPSLEADSPMFGSGIQRGDRILWADGEMIFSSDQLSNVINESTAFLTVQRGDEIFQTKVPRVQFNELKITSMQRAEMDDWQHEAGLKGRVQDLFFIPYLLSPNGTVELRLDFIDEADRQHAFQPCQRCGYFQPLEESDVVLAIDGIPIASSYDLLHQLQTRRALLIVEREPSAIQRVQWDLADRDFDDLFDSKDLQLLVSSIGQHPSTTKAGHLVLLKSVVPKTPSEQKRFLSSEMRMKKEIEAIKDPRAREEAQQLFQNYQRKVFLGLAFKDRPVVYNPNPLAQFSNVCEDMLRTFKGLFSGQLSPKYLAGPIGIVHVVQSSWSLGIKEALFWMAFISLNLGIVNLLPIPVLDGGHITFACVEAITHRRLSSKTMERLIIPFVGLIVVFFIYITFQDLSRIFSRFF